MCVEGVYMSHISSVFTCMNADRYTLCEHVYQSVGILVNLVLFPAPALLMFNLKQYPYIFPHSYLCQPYICVIGFMYVHISLGWDDTSRLACIPAHVCMFLGMCMCECDRDTTSKSCSPESA